MSLDSFGFQKETAKLLLAGLQILAKVNVGFGRKVYMEDYPMLIFKRLVCRLLQACQFIRLLKLRIVSSF